MQKKSTSGSQPHRSFAWRLFQFLGTMELAISLLILLAIASVIGTVLQQNQPYPDYVIKFGPYWFEVFEKLGLYDVYSALWFLFILTLLVISTSVCVIRNAPSMTKDMFNMRTNVQLKSIRAMHHRDNWLAQGELATVANDTAEKLSDLGFRTKHSDKEDDKLVAAMRGGMNRLGYILTHVAIVIICLGGLLDSNLPMKLAVWQGRIDIQTQNVPLSQIPQESRLPVGPQAFRGSISIPEGRAASVAYLAMKDGYLVQNLPFTIEAEAFRVEHYPTGQPKSFESDLVIYDDDMSQPLRKTISVNHPLIYKGYAIYQASFGDGGSELKVDAWPLFSGQGTPTQLDTKVFDTQQMQWGEQEMQLEITDFRPFNVNPVPTEDNPRAVKNFGPNMTLKLRRDTGEALEYQNYMNPVERDGRFYFLSGVRSSPADEFAYLYVPVDGNFKIDGFMRYLHDLQDKELIAKIATEMRSDTLNSLQAQADNVLGDSLQRTLETLVEMFMRGGFGEVREFIEKTLPEAERDTLAPAYLSMLREMLGRVYFDGLTLDEGEEVGEKNLFFLQDSIDAIGSLPRYGSPVFLALKEFNHIESTGLQIAHAPGKATVYLGCALLVIGIFLLFYLPQRRLWIWMKNEEGGVRCYLAGMSNRNPRDFDMYFEQIKTALKDKGNST